MTTKEELVLAQLAEYNKSGKLTVLGPASPIVENKSKSKNSKSKPKRGASKRTGHSDDQS
jgi:uncharacterized protein YciI